MSGQIQSPEPVNRDAVAPPPAEDFRDHLATADAEGRRVWIYPRQPRGRYYRARTWVSGVLLAILFAGPFIRIQGNPLLLLNVVERKFVILGRVFWPQDMLLFAPVSYTHLTLPTIYSV